MKYLLKLSRLLAQGKLQTQFACHVRPEVDFSTKKVPICHFFIGHMIYLHPLFQH